MTNEMRQQLIADLVTPFIQKSRMDVRFLTPFLKAAVEVLTAEVGGPVQRGELSLQRSAYTTNEVNVLITLVGRVQGVVIYGLSQATALAIISQIMGQPFDVLDELAQSGVGELGNVITGRASTLLADEGYPSQLSVPMLVLGKAMISVLDFPRLVVPLLIRHGRIEVHLAVREVAP